MAEAVGHHAEAKPAQAALPVLAAAALDDTSDRMRGVGTHTHDVLLPAAPGPGLPGGDLHALESVRANLLGRSMGGVAGTRVGAASMDEA